MAVVAVVTFLAAYILIATERVPKMVTALAGAGVILGFRGGVVGGRVLLPRNRHRLGRHLSAARHDDHRRGAATDRGVRVRRHLGGEAR